MRPALRLAAFPRWTPFSLGGNLLGWWSADDLPAGAVASWKDRVAQYNAAQGTGGSQPVCGAFGGGPLAGVTFDGTDDELTVASCPFPTGASASEVHLLVNQSALAGDTSSRQLFSYGSTSNATRRALLRRVSGGVNRYGADTGDNSVAVATNDASTDFSGRHYVRAAFGATATTVAINAQATVTGAVVPVTGSTRVRIGANTANTAAAFHNGAVRHAIVTGALGAGEANQLRRWLLDQTGAVR